MAGAELERWTELIDREALGEELDAEDAAWCEAFASTSTEARTEHELWRGLEDLPDRGPLPGSPQALVERVLEEASAPCDATDSQGTANLGPARRRARWLGIGGLVAAVAAAVVAILVWPDPPPRAPTVARAEIVHASGEVRIDGRPAVLGGGLLAEATEVTVQDGAACVLLDPRVEICTAADTTFRLAELSAAQRTVEVLRGEVIARLDPQPEGTRFSMVAGNVAVSAVGTVFAVQAPDQDTGPVVATVLEGSVQVETPQQGARPLAAHQQAQVYAGSIDLTATSRPEESAKLALLPERPSWEQRFTAVLHIDTTPSGAHIEIDGESRGRAPLGLFIEAGQHRISVEHPDGWRGEEEVELEPGERKDLRLAEPPRPSTTAVVEPEPEGIDPAPDVPIETPDRGPPPPSAESLLASAREQLAAGQRKAALRTYARLVKVHPKSAEAHAALVTLGDLQLELGRTSAAASSYRRYLDRGGGPLSREARLGRIRALEKLGNPAAERQAIEDFLARHGSSWESKMLRKRIEDLSREK